ncbi:hypothetical protein N7520_000524 [Penicillium odoratum]|uniref:uncharacterized protein n=1 Tax=Penicillium odoratum TaxID=1167516 RepID=UPI00254911BA|nr:uncharacterized protein N7520_000524 [Penicillium odoratum]KAJ5777278.1 hypothetical protein N7520_000524 [Penicillium odoratum]
MSSQNDWIGRKILHDRRLTPGAKITIKRIRWRIKEIINCRTHHMNQENVRSDNPSLVSIRLYCHDDAKPSFKAMMRIYVQIPWTGTEFEDSATLAKQAMAFRHPELAAYKWISRNQSVSKFTPKLLEFNEEKQTSDDVVPKGFITHFVWEFVPGVRLGDESMVATGFWENIKELKKRDRIRDIFKHHFE